MKSEQEKGHRQPGGDQACLVAKGHRQRYSMTMTRRSPFWQCSSPFGLYLLWLRTLTLRSIGCPNSFSIWRAEVGGVYDTA